MTQEQLAKALGVSLRTVNQLINGKRRVSIDLALRLGRFTKTSPDSRLNLQAAIDLWEATHSRNFTEIESIQP